MLQSQPTGQFEGSSTAALCSEDDIIHVSINTNFIKFSHTYSTPRNTYIGRVHLIITKSCTVELKNNNCVRDWAKINITFWVVRLKYQRLPRWTMHNYFSTICACIIKFEHKKHCMLHMCTFIICIYYFTSLSGNQAFFSHMCVTLGNRICF